MTGYRIEITCPDCGGELLPGESEILAPLSSVHVARCDRCNDLYRFQIVGACIERWPIRKCDPDARLARARAAAADGADPAAHMSLKGAAAVGRSRSQQQEQPA